MKPLKNEDQAIELLTNAKRNPLEGKELVTLLEYVFYVSSPRVTKTDFQAAALMAAKAFVPKHFIFNDQALAKTIMSLVLEK